MGDFIEVGRKAPAFSLKADDGSTVFVPNSLLFNNAVVVSGAKE